MVNAPLRPNYPGEIVLNSKIDPAEQAEVAAAQERKRLGLGDQPVIRLRRVLEWDVGLRIFYSGDLPSNIAGMYAYSAELARAFWSIGVIRPNVAAFQCSTSTGTYY